MDSVERLDSVLKNIFLTMPQILNEKQKRILSGSIAQGYGYGGIKAVSSVSGMDAKTIRSGIREIENGLVNTADSARIRREGAGRPGIEKKYRLFCFITKNWQGKPLIDINTTVNLISSTKTSNGLVVQCVVDDRSYTTEIKVSDDEFDTIDIEKSYTNPSWNYIIKGFKKRK